MNGDPIDRQTAERNLDIICNGFLFCINITIYKDNALENHISHLNENIPN